jgi:DNA processing protein
MLPPPERDAYLALALIPGIGPTRLRNLFESFQTYRGALSAPFALIRSVSGMSAAAATAVVDHDPEGVARVHAAMATLGGRILIPDDDEYPAPLRAIDDWPPVLFALGRLELLHGPAVAIVGTRHPTGYGIEMTRDVAGMAAALGITVVSGMARGLDAVAHWAALGQIGSTIGVLGNGLGVVYPAANRALYGRVVDEGLLLTEYPPGERPNAGSFLSRNRLISGLARATVVTEAPIKSGALKTAELAAEQSRDVLAVPGMVTSKKSDGTNRLIRDGVTPYLEPADLLTHYPEVRSRWKAQDETPALGPRLRTVFGALDGMPRSVDQLSIELRLNPGEVAGILTELEMAGLATAASGGFARAR